MPSQAAAYDLILARERRLPRDVHGPRGVAVIEPPARPLSQPAHRGSRAPGHAHEWWGSGLPQPGSRRGRSPAGPRTREHGPGVCPRAVLSRRGRGPSGRGWQPIRVVNRERVRYGDRVTTYTNLVAELVGEEAEVSLSRAAFFPRVDDVDGPPPLLAQSLERLEDGSLVPGRRRGRSGGERSRIPEPRLRPFRRDALAAVPRGRLFGRRHTRCEPVRWACSCRPRPSAPTVRACSRPGRGPTRTGRSRATPAPCASRCRPRGVGRGCRRGRPRGS